MADKIPDNCLTRNEWVCGNYYSSRSSDLTAATGQHVVIVVVSVLVGLLLAFPLALLARRYRRLEGFILGATTAFYAIPSLALFSLLVPLTGLGVATVVTGLAIYSLTVLVRAILEGLRGVPGEVKESATGLGYSSGKLLVGIELPLALPTIMAGLRVATVSTVALTTVGSILDAGGLGDLLVEGQSSQFKAQVLATSVLCVVLAIVLDVLLVLVQRLLTPWSRRRAVA